MVPFEAWTLEKENWRLEGVTERSSDSVRCEVRKMRPRGLRKGELVRLGVTETRCR